MMIYTGQKSQWVVWFIFLGIVTLLFSNPVKHVASGNDLRWFRWAKDANSWLGFHVNLQNFHNSIWQKGFNGDCRHAR
jgi:hypothetical protein